MAVASAIPVIQYKKKEDEYVPKGQEDLQAAAEYDFAYSVHEEKTGDVKSHREARRGDIVKGAYSLIEPTGYKRTVTYTADKHSGFQAKVEREFVPGYKVPEQPKKYEVSTKYETKYQAPKHEYQSQKYAAPQQQYQQDYQQQNQAEKETEKPQVEIHIQYQAPEQKHQEVKYESSSEEGKYQQQQSQAQYESPKYSAEVNYESQKYQTEVSAGEKYQQPQQSQPQYESPKYSSQSAEVNYETPRYQTSAEEGKYQQINYETEKYQGQQYQQIQYEAPKYESQSEQAEKVPEKQQGKESEETSGQQEFIIKYETSNGNEGSSAPKYESPAAPVTKYVAPIVAQNNYKTKYSYQAPIQKVTLEVETQTVNYQNQQPSNQYQAPGDKYTSVEYNVEAEKHSPPAEDAEKNYGSYFSLVQNGYSQPAQQTEQSFKPSEPFKPSLPFKPSQLYSAPHQTLSQGYQTPSEFVKYRPEPQKIEYTPYKYQSSNVQFAAPVKTYSQDSAQASSIEISSPFQLKEVPQTRKPFSLFGFKF